MDIISMVANTRSSTEERVANDYTVRQLMHLMTVYVRDKTMVLNLIAASLGGKGRKGSAPARQHSGLYSWFKNPKPGYRVVSLDAPLGELMHAASMGRQPGAGGPPVHGR